MAGKDCNKNFFAVAWPNDAYHEAAGQFATQRGMKSVYLIAPNYQAGKDSLSGFKRTFKGQVVGENYTKLGQLDYAAELAEVRAAKPQVLYVFLPGGMGINFIKQFVGAGLGKDMTLLLPGFSADQDVIGPVGGAMSGLFNTAHWSPDFSNAANQKFVAEFRKEYNRTPTLYASQGYDTARLIDAAVRDVKGKIEDHEAVRKALQGGEVRIGARPVQVQHQPVPDPELLRAHRRQRRQGRPDQQVVQRPDPQGPRRRVRPSLRDEVSVLALEQALNGLQFGLMLFLLAAGLTLVFGVMDMINLAHGSLYMVGAFIGAWIVGLTGSFVLGIVGAVLGTAAFGMALEVEPAALALRPRPPLAGARHLRPDPDHQRRHADAVRQRPAALRAGRARRAGASCCPGSRTRPTGW